MSKGSEIIALDADTGTERWRGDQVRMTAELTGKADLPVETDPLIDGVRLSGGQDDPMVARAGTTGAELWSAEGRLVYDNVWAVGDGVVLGVERDATGNTLAAYDIATGSVRWDVALDEYLWPFHISGEDALVMWNNLRVLSTNDGTVRWQTDHPLPLNGFPRMMGGVANMDSVFVSFTTMASGGD